MCVSPVWQNIPVNPEGHVHVKPLTMSVQTPPCRQANEIHSLISIKDTNDEFQKCLNIAMNHFLDMHLWPTCFTENTSVSILTWTYETIHFVCALTTMLTWVWQTLIYICNHLHIFVCIHILTLIKFCLLAHQFHNEHLCIRMHMCKCSHWLCPSIHHHAYMGRTHIHWYLRIQIISVLTNLQYSWNGKI